MARSADRGRRRRRQQRGGLGGLGMLWEDPMGLDIQYRSVLPGLRTPQQS